MVNSYFKCFSTIHVTMKIFSQLFKVSIIPRKNPFKGEKKMRKLKLQTRSLRCVLSTSYMCKNIIRIFSYFIVVYVLFIYNFILRIVHQRIPSTTIIRTHCATWKRLYSPIGRRMRRTECIELAQTYAYTFIAFYEKLVYIVSF